MTAGPAGPGWHEEAIGFDCGGDRLLGILTRPSGAIEAGLVVLPGGMQYRAGAHRQHVLLARAVAEHGIATLRFEGRGLGDGGGTYPGFTALGPDLRAAIAALRSAVPGPLRVMLYGLCDAATAIALELPSLDADGAILINPWVRSEQTLAAAQIRSHYSRQLLSPAFWRKLLGGGMNPWTKAREFLSTLARSREKPPGDTPADRLLAALGRGDRPLLVMLSDRDMTAAEFAGAVLPRLPDPPPAHLTIAHVAEADHTFSRAVCWQAALDRIQDWLAPQQRDRVGRGPHRVPR
jgi:exosortase A-associated hydrolase 1